MGNLTNYGKLTYVNSEGKIMVIQPKSYCQATQAERRQLLDLLMKGEYVLVTVAMPRNTFDMKGEA